MSLSHMKYFQKQKTIATNHGQEVIIYRLVVEDEANVLDEWSKHLREHYCLDEEIDILRSGSGLSKEDYLNRIKFPDSGTSMGAAIMSGDFSEILVHDYIEFVQGYYTTRTRYSRKVNRNSSTMGSDVLGYKCIDTIKSNKNDELAILEIKAQSSESKPKSKLQDAVDDSAKDEVRVAESLNAEVQRLIDRNRFEEAKVVQRFQNKTDRPYRVKFSAVAVHSSTSFCEELVKTVDIAGHPDTNVNLLVIYSDKLMEFIKDMYVRASKC
ncbi:DUF1837 domain-containing protein [Listeria monocytogenes]|uniref:Hachiman antiphage defense system protein HamA n=1 Tax=Listeria monocytogenes TaxID=1639 RepID=UPI000F29147F|nr:Hachiman antiphage defense system protein HamA [Listeria monocytogenes]EAC8104466.1 DUF1837 domain-containing protein [Listeria monocytogenes]EAD0724069.1 DUF1837 domain-containing protein [Listeria monocytogenes]EAE6383336.1 DUF1837 domain-containing protein [Listeria monocytogenes]EAE6395482.1 DUF1837 domain-containing protein [Listeria monocytogenes]EAE6532778.1 DUF1837 domain-containing protein [Listeria monocytogenes]